MDLLTWSHQSIQGTRYTIVLKCVASSCYKLIPLFLRSDATQALRQWVEEVRASPYFINLGYLPVQFLELDLAGEWGPANKAFQAMASQIGIVLVYATPDRHERTNAIAEKAVGIVEITTKGLLMETNLSPEFHQYAQNQAEYILNRLPLQNRDANQAVGGDIARPLEVYTSGRYSRAMCT